ncbi:MAG: pentapeptide repeat-containing protein, partial [Ktedonobacteraceae bacterium]
MFSKKSRLWIPKRKRRTWFSDKTGWDWLQFLVQVIGAIAIPLSIIVGLYTFTAQQKNDNLRTQQQFDENTHLLDAQQQETTLQTYFNDMTTLLFDDKLGGKAPTSAEAAVIARSKTITALSRLHDRHRKRIVVQFLYESHLIGHYDLTDQSMHPPIINLSGADLGGADFSYTTLSGANLSGALLYDADLHNTYLDNADLSHANLYNANLSYADLIGANLSGDYLYNANLIAADLDGANLSYADLMGDNLRAAHLEEADLSSADLSGANLYQAILFHAKLSGTILIGAIMPDGSTHP